jgi:hypothetical protein
MRYLIGKVTEDAEAMELLEDFVGSPEGVMELLAILGIDSGMNEPLEEMSAMGVAGGGAVAGCSGKTQEEDEEDPLEDGLSPSTRGRSTIQQRENSNMSLVNEVYELLIERGIVS